MITPEEARAELQRRAASRVTPQQAREELQRRGLQSRVPFDASQVASNAGSAAVSPFLLSNKNTTAQFMKGWQGLKPETQRSLGYMAASTVLPEAAGAAGAELPLLLRTLMRGGAGAMGSALKDVATGAPVSKWDIAITAGSEGLGGAIEGAGKAIAPHLPEIAEKFAKVSKPVYDMASKYGSLFKEKFPGTAEAIDTGAGTMNKFFRTVTDKTKGVREKLYSAAAGKASQSATQYAADVARHHKTVQGMQDAFEQAKKTAISDRDKSYISAVETALKKHAENIRGLSSGLSDKAQTLEKAGQDLRKAALNRGINVDPVEELKNARMGPSSRGGRHELAIHLPSRLPDEMSALEVRLKQFLMAEKAMPAKDGLIEAVRLKRAFQDLKHVQGGLNYAENEATNAYLRTLDKTVQRLDPAYSTLEKGFHGALSEYDRFYEKSKRIFDDLRQGEEIGVPREMLPKSGDFKPQEIASPQYPEPPVRPSVESPKMIPPSRLEGKPYGSTPGQTRDFLYRIMHPGEGREGVSKELRRRVGNAPGAEQAMGNIASKDLKSVFNRGMIYPIGVTAASAALTPIAMAGAHGKGKKGIFGGLGLTFAMAGLVRAAIQSPALYRSIATNPELIKAIVTRVPWAAKLFVAADQQ